jgi:Flp pilus assembly protein TadB
MAEETRTEDESPSVGEQARALKDDFSPSKLADQLEETARERPMLRHLLEFETVLKALAAAVVVALILLLLTSAAIAAIALVVVFFGGWVLLARRSYEQRRETSPVGESEEESGYQADRGEVEAEREQPGGTTGEGRSGAEST